MGGVDLTSPRASERCGVLPPPTRWSASEGSEAGQVVVTWLPRNAESRGRHAICFLKTGGSMEKRFATVLVALTILWPLQMQGGAQKQAPPTVEIPKPGVPEIMTMEGKFVRVAYNNEGYVVLGYQVANRSIGDEWMLLDLGVTVREKVPNY